MVNFSISSLTQGFNAGLKIAEITGFIESLNVKIDKLINTELNSGIKHLQNSERTDDIERKRFFLDEAYKCFTKALSLEKNERLCSAYIGYIYCLGCMNERENLRVALKDFSCKHFQIDFWSSINFKEEFVDIIVWSIRQNLLFKFFKLKKWILFIEEPIILIYLCFFLFFQYLNPQYFRLRIRYFKKNNVETFNELENRIKFFQKRKIIHKQIIRIVQNSETQLAEDTIKDSRKMLILIEKQMQIFELQKEAYNYANEL